MNASLKRALTLHSTWAAFPLFPVDALADAAPLNSYIDDVGAFLDQGLTSDEREYACLCSDFSQSLQRHQDFQGPLAARLFAIGSRHWLARQDRNNPHSNTGLLMAGSFWKAYSAECIRTFAPDRSLDWRSHVAAVSEFTKSLIKATYGNANTEYYCRHLPDSDDHEVVMDSLGMLSLSPEAGGALVFHEFMHGIKQTDKAFEHMYETARRGGYKGTPEELHPFFNSYEDIAVNVAGGSVFVNGLEDFRELYQGMFLTQAYKLKKDYSISGEFWVCAMARGIGENHLPFTPSAEVQALIEKHREALDELTCSRSLPISRTGLIRRDVCLNPEKLGAFSRYRGEAEARLFFTLQNEFSGQNEPPQNPGGPSKGPAQQGPGTGNSPAGKPCQQPQGEQQETVAESQAESAQFDPNNGKSAARTDREQAERSDEARKKDAEQSQDPGDHRTDSGDQGEEPAGKDSNSRAQGKDPSAQGKEAGELDEEPGAQGRDPGEQGDDPGDPSKLPGANGTDPSGPDEDPSVMGKEPAELDEEPGAQGRDPGDGDDPGDPSELPGANGTDPSGPDEDPSVMGKEPGELDEELESKGQGPGGQDERGEPELGGHGDQQSKEPGGAGNQPDDDEAEGPAGPDFSGLGEVGKSFELQEPFLGGQGQDAKTTADPDGQFKALEREIPATSGGREDLLEDGILSYGAPVDMSALRQVQREYAPAIRRGKRLFQGIRDNAERAVRHRSKLVEEGETFSIRGMSMRRSDPEHTRIYENPAQVIAVNHARFGLILDMSESTEDGGRFVKLVEMASVAGLAIEDAGYQTALGLFSSAGLLLYHADYPKSEKMRRLGGLIKVVRHSDHLREGAASVGLTRELGFMGGTESEKAVGTFVEAITQTQSRNPGHFHGLIFTDGGLTERRLKGLLDANPNVTWSILCEGEVTPEAKAHFGEENAYPVQLDDDFIKTIFDAFCDSIKKFGSFQNAAKIRTHYQRTLRDARRTPPETAINRIK